MTLKLYLISGAPNGWRAHLGLVFKKLEHETKYVEFSKNEHKKPKFLALNPRGTLPVLTRGDLVIRDSIAILAWLDLAYPENPLFGDNEETAGRIWQMTMEFAEYLADAGKHLLTPVLLENVSIPDTGSREMAVLQSAAEKMHGECRLIEELLADGPFIAGDTPTAADALAYPVIRLIQRAIEKRHDLMSVLDFGEPADLYPRTADWKTRIDDLEGVDRTLPIHW